SSPPRKNLPRRPAFRAGGVRPRAGQASGTDSPALAVLPPARSAARGAPAARARSPRAHIRQVRPSAVDAARPPADRHRRRARQLFDELDLMREAANASQLRRNFLDSPLLAVPEVYWDGCTKNIVTMQRMSGPPISQVGELSRLGVDIPQLARAGVEIFFTQV